MSSRRVLLFACLAFSVSQTARAQDAPLARILVDFLTEAVQMTSGAAGTPGNPHEAHFFTSANASRAPHELHKAIVAQLSTFPLGTSSGGFTYTLDPSTGAISPGSPSFGPSFAERPLTIGRGKFNAGIQYQHVEYDSYEGAELDAEEIAFVLQHNNCCPAAPDPTRNPLAFGDNNPPFEGDLIETRYALNVKSDMTVVFANVGLSNAFEVGVAVPFVRSNLRIGGTSTIFRLATAGTPALHSWDGVGGTTKTLTARGGSASGIGDILVRSKYAFVPGVLAAGVDFRLPSGDEADLLGTGGVQTRLMLIAGASRNRFAPHVNVGYLITSGNLSSEITDVQLPTVTGVEALSGLPQPTIDLSLPDEILYTGGFDFAASRRVTIAADIIGRTLRDALRFETSDSTFQYRTVAGGPLQTTTRQQFNIDSSRSNLHLLLGAVGAKINVATNLLLTANVLFPLSDGGLRPRVTPAIGFDYAF